MRSADKLEFWKLMAGIFAEWDVPSNDDGLVHQIHIVTDFLSQVREEMDGYFKIAPKVEQYFDLWDSEKENRRNPKYVEDAVTGELVLESRLVESTFSKFEKEVWSKVAPFRFPLSNYESRLKRLQLEAVQRGISIPKKNLSVEKPVSTEDKVAIFRSPPGLRWEDTTITFISDNDIRVEAKGLAEQYVYDEIGFGDKRAGGKGKLWDVLRALAMLKGGATVEDLANASKGKKNVSKDITRLRKILYNLMGIRADPFYGYKEHKCYQTKFTLRDQQMFGEHRKPEADSDELQEVYSEDLNPKWRRT